jgi:hypothetical protein
VNGGLARRSTISIAFSALVLGGLCAQATAAAPRSVKACELLASVVHRDFLLRHNLPLHTFTSVGQGWRCEFTSKPIKGTVSFEYTLLLYFFTSPSAAVAHENWQSLWHQARAAGRKAVRLPGSGADEAFVIETRSPHSTSTTATWRKGRYWGWLSMAGPGLRGDTEDVRDVLKDFLPGVPRSQR